MCDESVSFNRQIKIHFCTCWLPLLCPYFSNSNDSRLVKYEVYKNSELIKTDEHKVISKSYTHDLISYNDKDEFEIVYKVYDLDTNKHLFTKSFLVNQKYRQNQIHKNGKFTFKNMPG